MKSLPKGQKVELTYIPDPNKKDEYYVITKDNTDRYYLYSYANKEFLKIKTSNCPMNFKEVYP